MSELELYKFIEENNIEWHYQDNDGIEDVIIFPYYFQMESFMELIKSMNLDEGYPCIIKGNYFAIWMADICEYYGIELTNVFKLD